MRAKREIQRLEALLAEERARVEKLVTLLMSREAPQEFAAYIEPHSLAEEFPADAVWSEDGLFYVVPDGEE